MSRGWWSGVIVVAVLNIYNVATADSFSAWSGWMAAGLFFVGLAIADWERNKWKRAYDRDVDR